MLVTGATGIGAATARRVAEEGGAVFVVSLHERDVKDLCSELAGRGIPADGIAVDLTDEEATAAAFRRCSVALGPPDGVLAVAGRSGRRHSDGPVHDIPLAGWEATIEANMTPMFLTVREAVFVRSVAARYVRDGIRVNAIAPGLVRTPMSERAAGDPSTVAYAAKKQPLSVGFLPPESVATAAAFLLSDDARHITAQVLEVDGGWGVIEARP